MIQLRYYVNIKIAILYGCWGEPCNANSAMSENSSFLLAEDLFSHATAAKRALLLFTPRVNNRAHIFLRLCARPRRTGGLEPNHRYSDVPERKPSSKVHYKKKQIYIYINVRVFRCILCTYTATRTLYYYSYRYAKTTEPCGKTRHNLRRRARRTSVPPP